MTNEPAVLVVDDNADLLETFSLILKKCGFSVSTAGNGLAAIDLFRERDFDVILMDIVMPEMDGIEAFRKIRNIDPKATVILMTAYSGEESIQIAVSEGVRQVIKKPVRIDQLIDMIKEAAEEESILVMDSKTQKYPGEIRKSLVATGSCK